MKAKANGVIRCRISARKSGCQPCVEEVVFTPDQDHLIKHGPHKFVAFIPEGKEHGFVVKLCNDSIRLAAGVFSHSDSAVKAALHHTKVTVVVSNPNDKLKLETLIVPAEPAA